MSKNSVKACQECGWGDYPETILCQFAGATQHEKYPNASRHCTGFKNQPEPTGISSLTIESSLCADRKLLVMRLPDRVLAITATDDGEDIIEIRPPEDCAFDYGSDGGAKGCLALARAVLAAAFGNAISSLYAEQFCYNVVATSVGDEWGLTHHQLVEWIDWASGHDWEEKTIGIESKGNLEIMPTKCSRCGLIRRPDGRNRRCQKI